MAGKEKDRKRADRGASDDWEVIQMILSENPSIRQRVLHRLRALKRQNTERIAKKSVLISEEQYQKITDRERRGS